MIILLHSSKTMRSPAPGQQHAPRPPALLSRATQLAAYLKTLSPAQLAKVMHISDALAAKTAQVMAGWNADANQQSLAIDSFVGDIYSGLQADTLSPADRDYADQTLRILSGLYGILRPYDGVCPYRLEMGYKLPDIPYKNLYDFWGTTIADTLPATGIIVNTSSVEYTQTITPHVDARRIITPRFLTMDPKTRQPSFVVVHAKIARGAFARWLITTRIDDPQRFSAFAEIGYHFDQQLSTPDSPAFVAQTFQGKGLSMRLR